MKYGLLYYKDTDNIGDDIQSYAASRFLPRIDYLIDRENLESFVPNKKETVAAIMNAWYVHDKFNFRFSPYIKPLFISIFLKTFPYEDGIEVGNKYLNKSVLNSFKKYGPVGARDYHTKKILDDFKIDNYFSGCMTLTLDPFENVKKEEYIVTVGLTKKENEYIKKISKREVIDVIQDIPKGKLSKMKWEQRKKQVEKKLKLYQSAHMIITSKLHCALPSTALGVPVLLLYEFKSLKENRDRLGTYLKYVNHMEREKLFSQKINFDRPKSNPKEYLKIKTNLVKRCNEFISNLEELPNLPDIDTYKKQVEMDKNMRQIIENELSILQKKYVAECKKSSKYYNKSLALEEEIRCLKNSKFYYIYRIYRKMKEKLFHEK